MNSKKLAILGAMLALMMVLGGGSAAWAEHINTLNMTSLNYGYNVNVTFNALDGKGWSTKTVSTAELDVTLGLASGDFQDVIAYCVDLRQTISKNTNYTSYDLYPISQTMSTLQAGWLLGHYDPALGYAHAGYSTAATITALQLAIWEVTYDYSATYASNALGTGYFIANSIASESTVVRALANQFLASIPTQLAQLSLSGLGYSGVGRSSNQQDLVMGSNAAVPEPGSMLLLGSAAGLMGWWRRRQGRREPAQEA